MPTKDLTPQLMKGEVWSVNGQRGAVTLPEPVNSLDSDSTTAPLAAAQGKALKAVADGAKDGLDSKADKASNNFTTSLQLKGDGVATEKYVKTADVSGTKIDGKAIKTYIADAVKAGSGNTGGLVGTFGAINSVAFLRRRNTETEVKGGGTITGGMLAGIYNNADNSISIMVSGAAAGTWRVLGYIGSSKYESYSTTLCVRIA